MMLGLSFISDESKQINKNIFETIYNANRGLSHNKMCIEHGEINLNTEEIKSSIIIKDSQNDIEKNWVLFTDDKLKCIYNWYPLIIGDIVDNTFLTTHTIETPHFFKYVRGSTNGVVIDNEIWFISHIVSYEDRRYYYHLFIVLDPTTFSVKRYTKLFTFEKEKVEYTLGFVYYKSTDEFLIGYSTMDKTTKFMNISRSSVDKLFVI